jgi:predicted AAA+ superfamily ATPase
MRFLDFTIALSQFTDALLPGHLQLSHETWRSCKIKIIIYIIAHNGGKLSKIANEVPMRIERDKYMRELIASRWNGQIKVVTGLRRSGKSYLLKFLFAETLRSEGIDDDSIIMLELDQIKFAAFRNPLLLARFVREKVTDPKKKYYLFVDEIQFSEKVPNPYLPQGKKITFYDALNEFKEMENLDVYVTGSTSRMLSSDILTEFRGRGHEIRMHPLSFAEYYSVIQGDKRDALADYLVFGGMPYSLHLDNEEKKMKYLKGLASEMYIKDIVERQNIERVDVLDAILDLLASSVGSLTNPNNIANALISKVGIKTNVNTVRAYIGHLKDAFLFAEAKRYDVRGKAYFDYPNKYYCEDNGLRNARTGFRQQDVTHLMENTIYNELIRRGFSVDVGVVYSHETNARGNSVQLPHEIDFVVNRGGERVYIQSAYRMESEQKKQSEIRPFFLTGDAFRKIIIRDDVGRRWFDEKGILNLNLTDFLLDDAIV